MRRSRLASPDKITRAEELRLQLADEIVRGVLAPGAALDETELARRFNVSRTPVREAMRQLAACGPDRRTGASRRCGGAALDRTADRHVRGDGGTRGTMRRACRRAHARPSARLEAVHEELRVLIQAGDPQRYHEVNERFTPRSMPASQNAYVAEMTQATRCGCSRFAAPSSEISGGSRSRTSSTTASWSRSCAATAPAPRRDAPNNELVREEYEIYAVTV